MSSSTPVRTSQPIGGRRTLQRLRREAGYRSAKDFAKALGIPSSTYACCERAAAVDCGIPLSVAWQIADRLGCSIDLVVGRESIGASNFEAIQSRYDALSPDGRSLVDSCLSYVEFVERAVRDWAGR